MSTLFLHPLVLPLSPSPPLPSLELPIPDVDLIIHSSAGSGDDKCLGVEFDVPDSDNTLTCVAHTITNLADSPNIHLTMPDTDRVSGNGTSLSRLLGAAGDYTCTVCTDVVLAGIEDHCNTTTVLISSGGE